jgi:hypothetical protein
MRPFISFFSFFIRGFAILVASAEEMNGGKWARRAGFLWLGFCALYLVLIPPYLYKDMGVGTLLEHAGLALIVAAGCFAFSKACFWRREMLGESAISHEAF